MTSAKKYRSPNWLGLLGCLPTFGCGIGYTESTDFAPRQPGLKFAPKAESSIVIVPTGQRPHCSYQPIGTLFHVARAAMLANIATLGQFNSQEEAECANLLRRRAAALGGDGLYDLHWPGRLGYAYCAARVFVCTGAEARP